MVEQRVMVQPAQPVEWRPDQPAQTTAEASPPIATIRKVAVKLDQQGGILADGQSVDTDGLKNLLVKAREDGTIRLEVVVEWIASACSSTSRPCRPSARRLGRNVRVQALTASPD